MLKSSFISSSELPAFPSGESIQSIFIIKESDDMLNSDEARNLVHSIHERSYIHVELSEIFSDIINAKEPSDPKFIAAISRINDISDEAFQDIKTFISNILHQLDSQNKYTITESVAEIIAKENSVKNVAEETETEQPVEG